MSWVIENQTKFERLSNNKRLMEILRPLASLITSLSLEQGIAWRFFSWLDAIVSDSESNEHNNSYLATLAAIVAVRGYSPREESDYAFSLAMGSRNPDSVVYTDLTDPALHSAVDILKLNNLNSPNIEIRKSFGRYLFDVGGEYFETPVHNNELLDTTTKLSEYNGSDDEEINTSQ